tara:strand:- start:117 stop:977 length:861 start_codon:yes stop_codon:yes gene_type:complete
MSKLDKKTTIKISSLFQKKLTDIVSYSIEKNFTEYTMSDFNDFEPYVIFNDTLKSNHNRLFIFPPGGGGVESYINNIVQNLQDNSLVLFNNYYLYLKRNLSDNYIRHITYEKLAIDYLCYIKSLQAKGPYNLFGWSFGGILAFEVALHLLSIGDSVANIILIDSHFNYKKAALITGNHSSEKDNINYRYSPSFTHKLLQTNIVLFKALKALDSNTNSASQRDLVSENEYKIFKYYAEKTRSNHLDDILKYKKFKVKPMETTHESWINDTSQVIEICNEIKLFLKQE